MTGTGAPLRGRRRPAALLGVLAVALAFAAWLRLDRSPQRAVVQRPRPFAGFSVGMNLSPLSIGSAAIPFVDVFKETQPWRISRRAGPQRPGATGRTVIGPDGWVGSLARGEQAAACAFQDGSGHFPGGRYSLFYSGKGELSVAGAATVVASAPGAIKVQVDPAGERGKLGICIVETATDPADPIRDIRLIMPGFETTYRDQPFYPPFLNALKPFHTLRFMPWAHVNRSDVVKWSDTRTAGYATQALGGDPGAGPVTLTGVALDYQIALANTLGADPWFSVPLKADDDYIRTMARLVRRRLRPDLHPMIELSNEVWNRSFPEYQYALQRGTAMNLDPLALPRRSRAAYNWYALRSSQMFDIWDGVYGRDAGRIVHVIAGQQSHPEESERVLRFRDAYRKADVLAVGGYVDAFDLYHTHDDRAFAAVARMSVDDVVAEIERNIALLGPDWTAQKRIANRYGLDLVVYEGGFDLNASRAPAPWRDRIADLYMQAAGDPRLGPLYTRLLELARGSGVRLFCHFYDVGAPSPWGSWGALQYQDQDPATSRIYRALAHDEVGAGTN